MRLLKPILVLLLTAVFAVAAYSSDLLSTPQGAVMQYCSLDFTGAKLPSGDYASVRQLVTWEKEKASDIIYVTDKYSISDTSVKGDTAEVTVTYSGPAMINDGKLNIERKTEKVVYKLKKTDAVWKITSPMLPPHVSAQSLIKHYKNIDQELYKNMITYLNISTQECCQ